MSERIDPNKKLTLRVDLQPAVAEVLKSIMEERKFQYYSNAIRYCIIETKNKTEFKLDENYHKRIQMYLKKSSVRYNFMIANTMQFVNKALEHYFQYIDQETKSILDFDVRSTLTDEELEVAHAVINLQSAKATKEVTIADITNELQSKNHKGIENILSSFVKRGILDLYQRSGKKYYHATELV